MPKRIHTERLVLRPFRFSDALAVVAYASDPGFARYTTVPHPYEFADAEQFIARQVLADWRTKPVWSITLDRIPIGSVGLDVVERGYRGELAFGVAHEHWGKRLTTEAVRAVIDTAFARMPALVRLFAICNARNTASRRVMEKAGMQFEGIARSSLVNKKGELIDVVHCGITRGDWSAGVSSPANG